MKFGECYKVLEEGGFVSRTSWNGVFIWLKQKAMVKSEWCKDPVLKMLADANGGEIEAEQVATTIVLNSQEQNKNQSDFWTKADKRQKIKN